MASAETRQRDETIKVTKDWLHRCNEHDERCSGQEKRPMPSRLVDITQPNKVKLIETRDTQSGVYVALSYSWGEASRHMFKLNNVNKAAFQQGMSVSKLCLTHREAIQVAQELGYSFIWIDALCILQNDKDDWAKVAGQVPEVYNNADLVIVAGRSNDARHGFLAHRRPQISTRFLKSAAKSFGVADHSTSPIQLPYRCEGDLDFTTCSIILPRNDEIGPLHTRAWCYQELLMARRMIIYGEQQLSFRCRERHEFEDGTCNFLGKEDSWYNLLFENLSFISEDSLPKVKDKHSPSARIRDLRRPASYFSENPGHERRIQCGFWASDPILEKWYEMTADYSRREFYNPTDNHAALSGVVRLFKKVLISRFDVQPTYMAGLWEMDMIRGLLWRSNRIHDPKSSALELPKLGGSVVRRAPSWSWMALVGSVNQHPPRGGTPCCRGEPMSRRVDRSGAWGPEPEGWEFSMVKSEKFPDPFYLGVRGYVRELRISNYKTEDHSEYSTWLPSYTPESLAQHTFRLEAEESPPLVRKPEDSRSSDWPHIAATGLFDRDYGSNRPLKMWALRLTSEEGLLLERTVDPTDSSFLHKRLGIFIIENPSAFYPKNVLTDPVLGHYKVLEREFLDHDTVILI